MKPILLSTNRADYRMANALRRAGLCELELPVSVVVALGDRHEMLHACVDAIQQGQRLVHVAGGETMRGSEFPDHKFRNAISQLAELHCVSERTAALNLQDIGISLKNIVITGLPSLDELVRDNADFIRKELSRLGPPTTRNDRVFIAYHPYPHKRKETNARDALAMLDGVAATGRPVLISAPNDDNHGLYLRDLFMQYARRPGWALLPDGYNADFIIEIYKTFAVAVGNSSALRIEASLFGLPVVEVGDRQTGRVLPDNVRPLISYTKELVAEAVEAQAARRFFGGSPWANPRGQASEEIVAAIAKRFGCQSTT